MTTSPVVVWVTPMHPGFYHPSLARGHSCGTDATRSSFAKDCTGTFVCRCSLFEASSMARNLWWEAVELLRALYSLLSSCRAPMRHHTFCLRVEGRCLTDMGAVRSSQVQFCSTET